MKTEHILNKSAEILYLAEELRLAIPKDWRLQVERKERKRAWSQLQFDKDIYEAHPEINTKSALKSIYIYVKHNREKGVDEKELHVDRINDILKYLFLDLSTISGWPEVEEVFNSFASGKYMDVLRPFISDVKKGKVKKSVDFYGNGESTSTRLMQLALLAKENETLIENKIFTMETEKADLEKNLAIERERIAEMKALIKQLEKESPEKAKEYLDRMAKALE